MNDSETSRPASPQDETAGQPQSATAQPVPRPQESVRNRSGSSGDSGLERRRWWLRLLLQPALILASGALTIAGLGVAQRAGFLSAGTAASHGSTAETSQTRYICPMMCTPPQTEPGRCPVCAMELVPADSGSGSDDQTAVEIVPAARRVANIQTVAVSRRSVTRTIRAIGELRYDEGTLKTISAYVDGRLDRLYADYTGVVVEEGDHLALLYSPRLYSSQVEFLLARKAREQSRSATLTSVIRSNQNLYESARQRLIELGMTEQQIKALEQSGEANSRLHLCAPSSGTVIEKFAVEGEYVREGAPIYRLADLSTIWLMLELFPEDAAAIRYGQRVEARVQSLPGRSFTGRVAFVDPNVDPESRTVGVRVVIPNRDGRLRVGDYAKASIEVSLAAAEDAVVFDPELANKWISPRHPHIISASAGECPICGVELVPAAQFGFTDEPSATDNALLVPRDAVLMAGDHSVVYVETAPGRFELRRVVLGPQCGDQLVIRNGVSEGEQVATRGNFLIDSQMQLAGNPSLIDPTRAAPPTDSEISPERIAALSSLPPADRELAEAQRICPVTGLPLGSMGPPPKVEVQGTTVFLCCEGCREGLLETPEVYLQKLKQSQTSPPSDTPSASSPSLPPIGEMQVFEAGDDAISIGPPAVPVPLPDEPDADARQGLPPIANPQEIIELESSAGVEASTASDPIAGRPTEVRQ